MTENRAGRDPESVSNPWEAASWEGSRRCLLRQTLTATPAERLEWLEEMIEVAFATGALPRREAKS